MSAGLEGWGAGPITRMRVTLAAEADGRALMALKDPSALLSAVEKAIDADSRLPGVRSAEHAMLCFVEPSGPAPQGHPESARAANIRKLARLGPPAE